MDTTGRRARALRSILSLTFLLSIFAVTHASASCLKRASSALTSDGVRRSSALDQASVSWTSKAAWTCVLAASCGAGGDGHAARGGDDVWRTTPRHDASRPVMAWRGAAIVWTRRRRVARRVAAMARRRRTRLVCASRDARRAFVVGPGRRSSYLLLHVRRDARACGARSEVLGLQCMGVGARARGGCPFLVRRGARGGGASGRSYGSPPPMVVALRARKGSLSAAFTHEPCSCGSPAPRSGPGVAPAATSMRCAPEALYGSGPTGVVLRPAPPRHAPPRHRRTVT